MASNVSHHGCFVNFEHGEACDGPTLINKQASQCVSSYLTKQNRKKIISVDSKIYFKIYHTKARCIAGVTSGVGAPLAETLEEQKLSQRGRKGKVISCNF